MPHEPHKNPGIISTLRSDLSEGGFFSTLKREAREIEDFYLSDEERAQLKRKGRFWRWFVLAWWVVKNSFFKLSPFRRLLLVFGIVLALLGDTTVTLTNTQIRFEPNVLGLMCILVVLVLELKDKLLAHGELESGRAVQQAMNPERTPAVPGWDVWLYTRPANEVGGDLVDFLLLDGDHAGLAIGDVAGKGLGAALFMVKIQATLRALASDYPSLPGLASKLNSILRRDGMPAKFASLIFIRTDPGGTLRYVNAGHMPPLLVAADGVKELAKGNVALGLSGDAVYTDHEILLATGQTFVVYSDGLTEAQDERGEFYGADRLKDLCARLANLPARAFGERVVADVARFEGEARWNDDLSLVILRRAV